MSGFIRKNERAIWAVSSILTLLLVWQLASVVFDLGKFPDPYSVLKRFVVSFWKPIGRYTMLEHIGFSLSRVAVGYLLAAVVGIILGLGMGWFPVVRAFFKPLFDFLRPIPPIAWTPLAILWFGIAEKPKYFMIFIAGMIAFTLNAYTGATHVDKQLIGAARMLGASEKQVFFRIVIPSTIPQVFSGAQVALSACWMAVLGAEMIKSSEGAGWIIMTGSDNGNIAQVLVGMLAIAITGYVIVSLMRKFEGRMVKWNTPGK